MAYNHPFMSELDKSDTYNISKLFSSNPCFNTSTSSPFDNVRLSEYHAESSVALLRSKVTLCPLWLWLRSTRNTSRDVKLPLDNAKGRYAHQSCSRAIVMLYNILITSSLAGIPDK